MSQSKGVNVWGVPGVLGRLSYMKFIYSDAVGLWYLRRILMMMIIIVILTLANCYNSTHGHKTGSTSRKATEKQETKIRTKQETKKTKKHQHPEKYAQKINTTTRAQIKHN